MATVAIDSVKVSLVRMVSWTNRNLMQTLLQPESNQKAAGGGRALSTQCTHQMSDFLRKEHMYV